MVSEDERKTTTLLADFAAHMFIYILAEYTGSSTARSSSNSIRPTRIRTHSDIVKPTQDFQQFCRRILRATGRSSSTILLSLRFFQQIVSNLREKNKCLPSKKGSEQCFFTGILILADKMHNDCSYYNRSWAELTGITLEKIHSMERQFLKILDYRVSVCSEDYTKWLASLVDMTARHMLSQLSVAIQQRNLAAVSPIPLIDPTITTEPILPAPKSNTCDLIVFSSAPPILQQDRGLAWELETAKRSHSHPHLHPLIEVQGQ
ncbi:hypothetical protein BGZ47_007289 [Haplosporangium gracile]|nr:hypothetical protein BGZ47_007289 [Haplosporangium gracile]